MISSNFFDNIQRFHNISFDNSRIARKMLKCKQLCKSIKNNFIETRTISHQIPGQYKSMFLLQLNEDEVLGDVYINDIQNIQQIILIFNGSCIDTIYGDSIAVHQYINNMRSLPFNVLKTGAEKLNITISEKNIETTDGNINGILNLKYENN